MIVNETTIHQSSNEVDVSNYMQQYCLQQWENSYCIVGFKRLWHEKFETIKLKKTFNEKQSKRHEPMKTTELQAPDLGQTQKECVGVKHVFEGWTLPLLGTVVVSMFQIHSTARMFCLLPMKLDNYWSLCV